MKPVLPTPQFLHARSARLVRTGRRPAPQTGKMTMEKLVALIREGFGQGHLETYLPWVRVTKRDCSPMSNLGHLQAPEFGHKHHPRSVAQRHLLNRLAWCGVFDARDQYPIWPWKHANPLDGLLGKRYEGTLRGAFEIGDECGTHPGFYIGTQTPRVMTFHCLSTVMSAEGKPRLVAHQIISDIGATSDDIPRGRLANVLRGRYCNEARIAFREVSDQEVAGRLSTNLDAIRPVMSRVQAEAIRGSAAYLEVTSRLTSDGYSIEPAVVMERLVRDGAITPSQFQPFLHVALWYQDVDHDVSDSHEMFRPLKRGGIQLRDAMRRSLLPEFGA